MKKVFILLVMIISVTMSACTFSRSHDEDSDIEDAELKEVKRPASGTILDGREYSTSQITVTADEENNYVVTLKNESGRVLVSFFVRSGDTVTVGVPARKCYVYFASGKDWYGYGEGLMFGKNTHYSMDDELLDFSDGKCWSYTLEPIKDGNFSETPIDPDDFFSERN